MRVIKEFGSQILVFAIIAFVIVGLVLFVQGDDEDDVAEDSATASQLETSDPLPENTSQLADGEEAPRVVEEATLVAVNGYRGSGEATRSYQDGEFMHEIVADLDDPAEGKFYEGWLVGDRIVSTGRLENEGDNNWSLIFLSDEDLSSFDEVVVTEETEANGLDGIPETHVLDGTF